MGGLVVAEKGLGKEVIREAEEEDIWEEEEEEWDEEDKDEVVIFFSLCSDTKLIMESNW